MALPGCWSFSTALRTRRISAQSWERRWPVGPDERAEMRYTEVDFKVPVGVILGGEGNGLHALVRERCDFLVSIPTTGPVRALNVSVAAGVVLFEAVRQRGEARKVTTDAHR